MNLPFFYNILHCHFLILSSLLFSFTCFGQSESTIIQNTPFFRSENIDLEVIATSKADHKYVLKAKILKHLMRKRFFITLLQLQNITIN